MEFAAALHHSRDARPNESYAALRGQKTESSGKRPAPLEEVAEPQCGAATVGYVAAPGPLLSTPVLAVQFLLSAAVTKKEEQEERLQAERGGGEEDGEGG